MSDPAVNKRILEKAYSDWNKTKGGSVEELVDLCAAEINWHSVAEGVAPLSFTAKAIGKAEVRRYFDGLLDGWEMHYYRVDYFVAEGDRVVMVGSTKWTNKATRKTCETPKIDMWRFLDGKAIEFYEYYDTAQMLAAAQEKESLNALMSFRIKFPL